MSEFKNRKYVTRSILLICFLTCIITGFVDLDSLILAYKYNHWANSQTFWEYAVIFNVPLRLPWFTVVLTMYLRIIVGLCGVTYLWVKRELENLEKK